MNSNTIILASSSPARKLLLERLQISFKVVPPHIDESPVSYEAPDALAKRLAISKAKAIGDNYPKAYVIGSDQVIMCNDIRLDKPETFDNAVKQLMLVSNNSIVSYTGLCLLNIQKNCIYTSVERCEVFFRELTQETIASYIRKDNPLHCAGSIKAEGFGVTLLKAFKGNDPTALVGLPLIRLTDFLLAEKLL